MGIERFVKVYRRIVNGISNPYLRFAPAGHYYSPIPSRKELDSYTNARTERRIKHKVAGVDLRHTQQLSFFYSCFDRFGPLPRAGGSSRFQVQNDFFGYADAWSTYAMMRNFAPSKIIEVGSGFSSALMLDVLDDHPELGTRLMLVEPNPDRLKSLLMKSDWQRCEHRQCEVQRLPISEFEALSKGDILFIDSSHVLKAAVM